MKRHIITGRSHPALAGRIAAVLGQTPAEPVVETFPDGEVYVCIRADLMGGEVFVVQATGPPASENLMELMLLGDACRRSDAARLTAVLPYFGYARQDRRKKTVNPWGARMVADMIAVRYHRIVAVDFHNPAIGGFFTPFSGSPDSNAAACRCIVGKAEPLEGVSRSGKSGNVPFFAYPSNTA
jgi:ribose-phosphate pyrophosphokinase